MEILFLIENELKERREAVLKLREQESTAEENLKVIRVALNQQDGAIQQLELLRQKYNESRGNEEKKQEEPAEETDE